MSERWVKTGLLVETPTPQPWARSHAALPVATAVTDDGFELHYSARDERNRAHIARATVRIGDRDALEVTGHDPDPLLAPGELGAFDDCGVTSACVVADGDRLVLYYTGWTLARSVPFLFYVGAAVSEDGGRTYSRASRAPVLGRSDVDPFLTASPSVMRDGDTWRMWYVSCEGWDAPAAPEAEPRHRYHLRYAESEDGLTWEPTGRVVVDFADEGEYAFARPHVVREGGRYRMWFCVRGEAYRLGYAESADGLDWERDDGAVDLPPTPGGWDGEMVCYPHVVDVGSRRHLLYNGNGYGRSGIGAAVAEAAS